MANLKEIRNRIGSVKSTRQITSAMKMVSAAKLRRAQDNVIQLRPYADRLTQVLYNISNNLTLIEDNPYITEQEINRVALVVITSNKGLCGAFNANVIKQSINHINSSYELLNKQGMVDIITIGKKGSESLKGKGFNVVATYDEIFDDLDFMHCAPIIKDLSMKYLKGYYNRIELVYNRFKNAAIQELQTEQLLPLKPLKLVSDDDDNLSDTYYLYEPGEKEIINDLVPKVVNINFYGAILDSFASEHGARMTAMHKATDNASELIKDLTLLYNKARQATITNEILEIVGGAEALNG